MSYPRIAPATIASAPTPVTSAPTPGERGPLTFAPSERIAAFVVGALVWFALAASERGGGAPDFGDSVARLADIAIRDGYTGPMAFSASVGAAFLLRELRRARVRGLERVACLTLSTPLFQVVAVALLSFSYNLGSSPVTAVIINAVGSVLLVIASCASLGGGIAAFGGAWTNRNERLAAVAIPLLWMWQWYGFLPWSSRWLASP